MDHTFSSSFEVEQIVDEKLIDNQLHYLIKWIGYGHQQNTWEPMRHMTNSRQKIMQWEEFKRKHEKLINERLPEEDNNKQLIKSIFDKPEYKKFYKKQKISRKKKQLELFQQRLKSRPKPWQQYKIDQQEARRKAEQKVKEIVGKICGQAENKHSNIESEKNNENKFNSGSLWHKFDEQVKQNALNFTQEKKNKLRNFPKNKIQNKRQKIVLPFFEDSSSQISDDDIQIPLKKKPFIKSLRKNTKQRHELYGINVKQHQENMKKQSSDQEQTNFKRKKKTQNSSTSQNKEQEVNKKLQSIFTTKFDDMKAFTNNLQNFFIIQRKKVPFQLQIIPQTKKILEEQYQRLKDNLLKKNKQKENIEVKQQSDQKESFDSSIELSEDKQIRQDQKQKQKVSDLRQNKISSQTALNSITNKINEENQQIRGISQKEKNISYPSQTSLKQQPSSLHQTVNFNQKHQFISQSKQKQEISKSNQQKFNSDKIIESLRPVLNQNIKGNQNSCLLEKSQQAIRIFDPFMPFQCSISIIQQPTEQSSIKCLNIDFSLNQSVSSSHQNLSSHHQSVSIQVQSQQYQQLPHYNYSSQSNYASTAVPSSFTARTLPNLIIRNRQSQSTRVATSENQSIRNSIHQTLVYSRNSLQSYIRQDFVSQNNILNKNQQRSCQQTKNKYSQSIKALSELLERLKKQENLSQDLIKLQEKQQNQHQKVQDQQFDFKRKQTIQIFDDQKVQKIEESQQINIESSKQEVEDKQKETEKVEKIVIQIIHKSFQSNNLEENIVYQSANYAKDEFILRNELSSQITEEEC